MPIGMVNSTLGIEAEYNFSKRDTPNEFTL